MNTKHKWTKEEDIVVLYLSKYDVDGLGCTKQALSNRMGMSLASLDMRIKNFHALDGKGGLPHFSKTTSTVYQEYKDLPQSVLRDKVIQIIQKLSP